MTITKIKIKLERPRKMSLHSDGGGSLLPSCSDWEIAPSEDMMLLNLKQEGEIE